MSFMDDVDKLILNRIQSDFPITENPFSDIAMELGLSEDVVIERVQRLKEQGIIRRIGGNFSPEKLGYVSTLCAGRVPPDKIDLFTEIVNSYPGVTHNYLRENTFNVWFTFIAPSRESIETSLAEISKKSGGIEILNLPATDVFKIRAQFKL
jgi:siroheme decarboxylase